MNSLMAYARRSLAKALVDHKIRAEIDGDVVRPGRGTPEIRISEIWFRDSRDSAAGKLQLAEIVIDFALNPDRPDSVITDHVVGWAETQEEAIDQAIHSWITITAPPIFSLLQSKPVMEAEWIPSGDPLGIPGWDVFTSPYGFRGDKEEQQRLQEFLQECSLMSELAVEINAAATREHFNYVKLYRGFDGSEHHVECMINGERDHGASMTLEQIPWPKPQAHRFVSVGEFLLLIKPLPTDQQAE